jgi:hypothetical protein
MPHLQPRLGSIFIEMLHKHLADNLPSNTLVSQRLYKRILVLGLGVTTSAARSTGPWRELWRGLAMHALALHLSHTFWVWGNADWFTRWLL